MSGKRADLSSRGLIAVAVNLAVFDAGYPGRGASRQKGLGTPSDPRSAEAMALFTLNEPDSLRLRDAAQRVYGPDGERVRTWAQEYRAMADRARAQKAPIERDKAILSVALGGRVRVSVMRGPEASYPVLYEPCGLPFFAWIMAVWQGKITVKRCEAPDCRRYFVAGQEHQRFCSKRCRMRVLMRRKRQLATSS